MEGLARTRAGTQPLWRRGPVAVLVACGLWLGAVPCVEAICTVPPGDLDGNGTSNVIDIQCAILAALWSLGGQETAPPECIHSTLPAPVAADHNCDRVVNVADVGLGVYWALGLPLSASIDADGDGCVDACQTDLDGDGTFDFQDCAPHDPSVHPGAAEVCNGFDDDCDGTIDGAGLNPTCDDYDVCTGVEVCDAPPAGAPRIDEVMALPSTGPQGQWVEVFNPGSAAVNLRHWTLEDAAGVLHDIDPGGALFVPAGGYLVIGASTDEAVNGGVLVWYAASGLNLGGVVGHVVLRDPNGMEVSRVDWDAAWPMLPGASMARIDPVAPEGDPASWSASISAWSGGDAGTPGGPNRDVMRSWCLPGTPLACPDPGPCFEPVCDPVAGCGVVEVGGPCDDGNACTAGDACSGGTCGGVPVDCDDGEPCTDDACNPAAGCTHTPATGGSCDDGVACTISDVCVSGTCQGAVLHSLCDDANVCTDDVCDVASGGCVHFANGAPCDDGNPCTTSDACSAGACHGGPPPACDDANSCTEDGCDPATGCTHTPNTFPCDDGNPCTLADACNGGVCAGGTWNPCDDANPCTSDACDPASGCTHAALSGPACDDGDACTVDDACTNGLCIGGAPRNCNDANPCTDDACDPGSGCVHTPSTTPYTEVCYTGPPGSLNVGACQAGTRSCVGSALGPCVGEVTPGTELCFDGIDNDCDGIVDEGEVEQCGDGIDNDCDGFTDESAGDWGEVFFARGHYGTGVAIYRSNGDGTFTGPLAVDFPDQANYHYAIHVIGDFDGDGFFDLIVSRVAVAGATTCTSTSDCPANYVCWSGVCKKECTTDADCTTIVPNPIGTTALKAAKGDKCIDGNPTHSEAADRFCRSPRTVLLAQSACGGGLKLTPLFAVAPGEYLAGSVDADGNGQIDLVALRYGASGAGKVWLNDGAMHFAPVDPAFDYASLIAWSYRLGTSRDYTGDGRQDLLMVRYTSGGNVPGELYVFASNGDGTFQAPQALPQSTPGPANLLAGDDFNRDGFIDLVAGLDDDGDPGQAYLLLRHAGGWTGASTIFDVAPSFESGQDHPGFGRGQSYDFDGDHYPDLVITWFPESCGGYAWGCALRALGIVHNATAHQCPAGFSCVGSQCVPGCTPQCAGRECGDDGCGGACGVCAGDEVCQAGQCVAVASCVPQCAGKACGDNGCGGSCGTCAPGESCVAGQCVAGCVPDCTGKQCGDDGCGGTCPYLDAVDVLEENDNTDMSLAVPANAPPTAPAVSIAPVHPHPGDTLTCTLVTSSYDLDAVTYRFAWYRNGQYVAAAGNTNTVPGALVSSPGDVWQCRVRATDGVEWSPEASATVVVKCPPFPQPCEIQ